MNSRIHRFFLSFFSLLLLLSASVPAVSAQSPTADLALTKKADRKTVKIGQNITVVATPISNSAGSERRFTNTAFIGASDAFDPNSENNSASLHLHIVGKTP